MLRLRSPCRRLAVHSRGTKVSEDPKSLLRLENLKEPCRVGFALNDTISCPLFEIEPSLDTVGELLATLGRCTPVLKDKAINPGELADIGGDHGEAAFKGLRRDEEIE